MNMHMSYIAFFAVDFVGRWVTNTCIYLSAAYCLRQCRGT